MSKLKHKACSSFKEFRKIERKYTRKFFNCHSSKGKYNYRNHWYTWIWYDAIGMDSLNDDYLNRFADYQALQGYTNLKQILQEARDNFNWSYTDKEGIVRYLKGVEISNEDFYWIYISEDGKKSYSSCVGAFDTIDWKKHTVGIYNKSTGELEIAVDTWMLDKFKEKMIEEGFDLNNYEFKKYDE